MVWPQKKGVVAKHNLFHGTRSQIKQLTVHTALDVLRRYFSRDPFFHRILSFPGDVLDRVSEMQQRLKKAVDGVRWVRPEGIHLTLQFLGDIREEGVADIHAAMTSCATGFVSMKVSLGKLGSFPKRGMPRVIWAGLDGDIDRLHPGLEIKA